MAIVPTRNRRAEGPVESPRPRVRVNGRAARSDHSVYPPGHVLHEMMHGEPYPAPRMQLDEVSGRQVVAPMGLTERLQILAALDIDEAEELLLASLQQFMLAKTPLDTICQRMGITPAIYKRLKAKLMKKVRDQVKGRDPFDFIAPIFAELDEVKAAAWRDVAAAKPGEWGRRMASLNTVLKATSEIGKMLQLGGTFDNSPMRAPLAQDGEDVGGSNALKRLAQGFLSGEYAEKNYVIPAYEDDGDD